MWNIETQPALAKGGPWLCNRISTRQDGIFPFVSSHMDFVGDVAGNGSHVMQTRSRAWPDSSPSRPIEAPTSQLRNVHNLTPKFSFEFRLLHYLGRCSSYRFLRNLKVSIDDTWCSRLLFYSCFVSLSLWLWLGDKRIDVSIFVQENVATDERLEGMDVLDVNDGVD